MIKEKIGAGSFVTEIGIVILGNYQMSSYRPGKFEIVFCWGRSEYPENQNYIVLTPPLWHHSLYCVSIPFSKNKQIS